MDAGLRTLAGHRGRDPRRRGPRRPVPRQDQHRGVARRAPHRARGRPALEHHDHVRLGRAARGRGPATSSRTRDLQKETGGFTEFVPLPFVHMAAPIYLQHKARRGPTFREVVLMHAVGRIAYHGLIDNIQASWVKLGARRRRSSCCRPGVNDLGGTLMDENISRAAGRVATARAWTRTTSARSSSRSAARSSSAPRSTAASSPSADLPPSPSPPRFVELRLDRADVLAHAVRACEHLAALRGRHRPAEGDRVGVGVGDGSTDDARDGHRPCTLRARLTRHGPPARLPRHRTGDAELDDRIAELLDEVGADARPRPALRDPRHGGGPRRRRHRSPRSEDHRRRAARRCAPRSAPSRRTRTSRRSTIFGSARTLPDDPLVHAGPRPRPPPRRITGGWSSPARARGSWPRAWRARAGASPSASTSACRSSKRPNPFIAGDEKLISMKYFFTRKLMLMKESRASSRCPVASARSTRRSSC